MKKSSATKTLKLLIVMRSVPTTVLILLFTLSFSLSYSQQASVNNAVFKLDVFKTEKEKKLFAEIDKKEDFDFLSLYLATDPSLSKEVSREEIQTRITDFINASAVAGKQELKSKELKKIYKDIHNAFLSKYSDNPTFSQLFVNGDYNCATATALYALMLEKLSIDYNIRETPQHVYIIAAPQTHNIIFETTAPGARFYQFTDKGKAEYVEYLYNNKMISKEEWANGDKNEIFNKHFYTDELIDKRKLAGLLYYNLGVEATNKEDYKEAYKNFEKAYFLYPDKKIKYFVSVTLASVLFEKTIMENENSFHYFLRFTEVNDNEIAKSILKEYMEGVTKKLLFQFPDYPKYKNLYQSVSVAITDSSLARDIRYNHYYNTAHYYSIKNKLDTSLQYLDSVYALNEKDLLVQELIAETIAETFKTISDESKALDSLKKVFQRYPFIDKKSSKLGDYYGWCLSRVTGIQFQKNKKKEGMQFLSEIKEIIETNPELSKKMEIYFTAAFVEVYYYYVRNKEYKEAKSFLLSVMKYYPEQEELKLRMKRIDEILSHH
jgi:hypothetical protein